MLHLSLHEALGRYDGSMEILRAQVGFVLEDVPSYLVGLNDAIAAGDCRQGAQYAHVLMGSMLSIDAEAATELARKMESACQNDDVARAATLLPHVRVEVNCVLAGLADWMGRHPETAQ